MGYKQQVRCGMGQFSRVPGVYKERQGERESKTEYKRERDSLKYQ